MILRWRSERRPLHESLSLLRSAGEQAESRRHPLQGRGRRPHDAGDGADHHAYAGNGRSDDELSGRAEVAGGKEENDE